MEKIRRTAFIEATPSRIFEYLDDPNHLLEIWPSMVEVAKVEVRPDGGQSFDWTYKMGGVKFHGHSHTPEVVRDRLRLFRNEGGIPSTFRWGFEPLANGTQFTLDVEYEIPGSLLGRIAAPFLRRLNEREADVLVANLKERMELTAGE
jgi:uncharacterized protein YndB with AHSA1/START domain